MGPASRGTRLRVRGAGPPFRVSCSIMVGLRRDPEYRVPRSLVPTTSRSNRSFQPARRETQSPRTGNVLDGTLFSHARILAPHSTCKSRLPRPGLVAAGRDLDRDPGRGPGRGDLPRGRTRPRLRPLVRLHATVVRRLARTAGRQHPGRHAHSLPVESAADGFCRNPRRPARLVGRLDRHLPLGCRCNDRTRGRGNGRPRRWFAT